MADGDDDGYVDSKYPTKRVAAHFSRSQSPGLENVLMERPVDIDDLKYLKFKDKSLYTIFRERQWMRILEPKDEVVYPNIVRKFYENRKKCSGMEKNKGVFVREVKVVITPEWIASHLDLPRSKEDPESSHYSDDQIYCALTDANGEYDHHKHQDISQKDLTPFFQMLHLIVSTNVSPTEETTKVNIRQQGKFLVDIARGVNIDLANHIFRIIKGGKNKKKLPFGLLITGLLLKAGVKIESDEQGQRIRLTEPISQTRSLPYPSTQQATTASSSEGHQTRPPWLDAMINEIDLRVAAQIAPIQSQLKDMNDRIQELHGIPDERDYDQPSSYI